jgi:hypothetical protein
MHIKSIKDVPLFPVVPIVPAAILVGSVIVSLSALIRVRRLEKRLAALAG